MKKKGRVELEEHLKRKNRLEIKFTDGTIEDIDKFSVEEEIPYRATAVHDLVLIGLRYYDEVKKKKRR